MKRFIALTFVVFMVSTLVIIPSLAAPVESAVAGEIVEQPTSDVSGTVAGSGETSTGIATPSAIDQILSDRSASVGEQNKYDAMFGIDSSITDPGSLIGVDDAITPDVVGNQLLKKETEVGNFILTFARRALLVLAFASALYVGFCALGNQKNLGPAIAALLLCLLLYGGFPYLTRIAEGITPWLMS